MEVTMGGHEVEVNEDFMKAITEAVDLLTRGRMKVTERTEEVVNND